MCGIVGFVGESGAKNFLIEGLRRLEYRGYDSAGICLSQDGDFNIVRSVGKIAELEKRSAHVTGLSRLGIGHTRWATHGKVTEKNAHPHVYGDVAVVHNGIIENYFELRNTLKEEGHVFNSETDTEIIAHLIDKNIKAGDNHEQAIINTVKKLKGIFSLAIMFKGVEDHLYAVKNGTPLVIGRSGSASFIASDIYPLSNFAEGYFNIEDLEIVRLTSNGTTVLNMLEEVQDRKVLPVKVSGDELSKQGFRYYMEKEIHEQPNVVTKLVKKYLSENKDEILTENFKLDADMVKGLSRIYIVACGTAWHAALIAKYYIEKHTRIPVDIDVASEFRYRDPIFSKNVLTVLISQSGETADTLAACKEAKEKGSYTIAICNRPQSTLHRTADYSIFTEAGIEMGVAATKSFTSQVVVMLLFSLSLAKIRGTMEPVKLKEILTELVKLPYLIEAALHQSDVVLNAIDTFHNAEKFLFIGRGIHYPIALEGALKLKEITYLHAEGYPGGELKHGPIALVDENMVLLAISPKDDLYDKTISNIEEIKARGASVISVGTQGDDRIREYSDHTIQLPKTLWEMEPVLESIPVQLLALYLAIKKGTDVDQPRNLAKSVTVE